MALIDEKTGAQVRQALEGMQRDVELLLYTGSGLVVPGRDEPGEQRSTLELLSEVAELGPRLELSERPLSSEEARANGIELAPTLVLREKGSDRHNIRFSGLPSGYEFQTLIAAILLLGGDDGDAGRGGAAEEALAEIATTVKLRSFVTPGCPHCPRAVLTGFRFALRNESIVAEGIAANEFPLLSRRYRISGVPDTIIEGERSERVLGGQPERVFVEAVRRAAGLEA